MMNMNLHHARGLSSVNAHYDGLYTPIADRHYDSSLAIIYKERLHSSPLPSHCKCSCRIAHTVHA